MSSTWTSPRAISALSCSLLRFSMRCFAASTIWPTVFFGTNMADSFLRRPIGPVPRHLTPGRGRRPLASGATEPVEAGVHGARRAGQWLLRARVFTRGDSGGGKRAPNMASDSVEDGDVLRARSLLFVLRDGR